MNVHLSPYFGILRSHSPTMLVPCHRPLRRRPPAHQVRKWTPSGRRIRVEPLDLETLPPAHALRPFVVKAAREVPVSSKLPDKAMMVLSDVVSTISASTGSNVNGEVGSGVGAAESKVRTEHNSNVFDIHPTFNRCTVRRVHSRCFLYR